MFIKIVIFLVIFLSGCDNDTAQLPLNSPPSIISRSTISTVENNSESVFTVLANDTDNDDITYSIVMAAGDDSSLFLMNSVSGDLSFVKAPDYESPSDFNKDNRYQFKVSVNDGLNSVIQSITVIVTDKTELLDVCRRAAGNLLANSSFISWGRFPADASLGLSINNEKVFFSFEKNIGSRLFIGSSVFLKKNKKYAFRLKVSNFTGNYDIDNFVILGGNGSDFIGNRQVKFSKDGVYGMVFQYVGEDNKFLLRLGIGTLSNDLTAANSVNAGFSVEELMWEELDSDDIVPSEYVLPSSRWCFSSAKGNVLDSSTGLLTESKGVLYNELYKSVWVITADSFGNDAVDFPNRLRNVSSNRYTLFVDSIPGRTLAVALNVFEDLLTIKNYPQGLTKPYGVIIQGGVNDIVGGRTLSDLKNTVNAMLNIASTNELKSLILTVPPFKNSRVWDTNKELVRVEYNQWLRTVVNKTSIYLVDIAIPKSDGGLAADSDVEVLDQKFDVGDGLHPNIDGSTIIAEKIRYVLDGL